MDRETLIQNVLTNYGQYGVTREIVEPLIELGEKEEFSYDLIYLGLKTQLCKLSGEEFYCTSSDMARAFGVSEDVMQKIIEESRQELIAAGENPDEYFREVQATRFVVQRLV